MVSFDATASIGSAGGDVAEQRQLDRAAAGARRHHLDRSAAVPRALDEALFLQVGEVLVHRRERRQTEAATDLFETRRIAVLADELVQVVEDLALTLRQWQHVRPVPGLFASQTKVTIRKRKAKVNWVRYHRPRRAHSVSHPASPREAFGVVGFGLNSVDLLAVVAEHPQPNTKQRLQRFRPPARRTNRDGDGRLRQARPARAATSAVLETTTSVSSRGKA